MIRYSAVDPGAEALGSAMGALVPIMIVSVVVSLGLLVWYLWAMARLFPRIGLKSTDGWIPIWNQWKLLERAGLPGWVVLLSFVGLSIVPAIMLIMAMHRIGKEHGAGVGYTVLGVFIAPLWATLLANHIGKSGSTSAAAGAYKNYAAGAPAGASAGYTAAVQPGFVAPPVAPGTPTAFAPPAAQQAPAQGAAATPLMPMPAAPAPAAQQPWAVSGGFAPQQQSPLGGETEA